LPATPVLLGDYELLSPEDMRYDLGELFHRIESTHPDPYARRPKAEVDRERQRIADELGQPATMIDFFGKVEPLVASLGGYHTYVSLPDDTFGAIAVNELFFPFLLAFDGQRAIITADYSRDPDIAAGAELLAINGTPIASLQEQIAVRGLHLYPFWLSLWFLYGSVPEYQLEVAFQARTSPTMFSVVGLTSQEINQRVAVPAPLELVGYATLPGEQIGVLTINNLGGIGPLLKPAFAQMQQDGVQHLVVDIRANRGGFYDDIDRLMDYLTDQPYRICSRKYQAPFRGYGEGAPREMACDLNLPFNAAERYRGQLYLLIGPDTLSAAITLATVLQDYDLAILIGEETADSASYCADVPTELARLPRTGLRYMVPRTCFVRPNGLQDDQGVVPDLLVTSTVADRLAGNDPVLTATLDLIRSGTQSP
jgi:hypothetical protein